MTIQRTPADALYSLISGRDCSVVRLDQGKSYCRPVDPPPEPPVLHPQPGIGELLERPGDLAWTSARSCRRANRTDRRTGGVSGAEMAVVGRRPSVFKFGEIEVSGNDDIGMPVPREGPMDP